MPHEIPPEIVALRQRLAELEAMTARNDFNEAFRRAAGQAPAEAEPETPTTEPIRQEGFNETLRRLRGFTE